MAQKGETLVEVKDLCKNFGVTIALSHVDFVVKTGEIRGLIGENGSGKSTVSSIIAGMQPASSGEMFYKGKLWKPATMLEAQKAGIDEFVVISNHKFAQHGKTEKSLVRLLQSCVGCHYPLFVTVRRFTKRPSCCK